MLRVKNVDPLREGRIEQTTGIMQLASLQALAAIAPSSPRLPWVVGAILLVAFIPEHILIWVKFPVWYHLVFLVTLAPLVALGAALCRRRAPSERSA